MKFLLANSQMHKINYQKTFSLIKKREELWQSQVLNNIIGEQGEPIK